MKITANPAQIKFLKSSAKYALYLSGRGGGKTWAGSGWTADQMYRFPGSLGMACAQNPVSCNTVVLPALTKYMDRLGWPWVFGKAPPWYKSKFQSHVGILSIPNGSQLLVKSAFEYDRSIRGNEVGFAWIDEARELELDAFNVIIGCLRGQKKASYQVRLTTTPAGFNWLFDRFADKSNPSFLTDSEIITSTTSANRKHLPSGYEQELMATYGATLAKQEISGEFCSLSEGAVFEFKRPVHVRDIPFNPDLPVGFGMDFNISPLLCEIVQIDRAARTCYVIDEINIASGGQTSAACEEFVRRYKGKAKIVEFVGDQAGAHGDTRAAISDIDIMRQIMRREFPQFRDLNDNKRHRVINRVNCMNALLNPAVGDPKMFISPKCKALIKDFEMLTWEPGTKQINKSNTELSHASDALGYIVERVLPLQVGQVISGWQEKPGVVKYL